MGSNNYAEQGKMSRANIVKELRTTKAFHLFTSNADELLFGKDGVVIEDLEFSPSLIDSGVALDLFLAAKKTTAVNFGNGYWGLCLQFGQKYIWLAPARHLSVEDECKIDRTRIAKMWHRYKDDPGFCDIVNKLVGVLRAESISIADCEEAVIIVQAAYLNGKFGMSVEEAAKAATATAPALPGEEL